MANKDSIESHNKSGLSKGTQILILVAIVALLSAGLGGVFGFKSLITPAATEPPPAASANNVFKPNADELAGLVIKPVEEMSFRPETATDGYIATDDNLTTQVFSPVSGRVTQLTAKPGDYVANGAPLVVVEAPEIVQAQNDLIAAQSNLASVRAQLDLAHTNEQRQHELYESEGAALRDWQQSQVDLATAEGNFRNAEIALTAVRNRVAILGKSPDEISALGNMQDVQRSSPTATVHAPIAGTILQRQVGVGQYIQAASATPLFVIGNLSTVWLIANVREADAPRMHLGDVLEVHVLAFPQRVFRAQVSYLAPSLDAVTHRLAVRADIENRDGALKPQMFANFSIITGQGSMAPAVPQSAIIYDSEAAHVWVLGSDGALTLRKIQTGRSNGQMVEAVSGVSAGEKIVTSGTIFIDRAATGG
jgi:cobalt-zinc-cadmium efflux system membrane fusion protein